MKAATEVHESMAELLTYPGCERVEDLVEALRNVAEALPECAGDLEPLSKLLAENKRGVLEELFTRTFDNNSERALELGWQIHGENYDRGAFMVQMRELLRDHGIEESTELPDHLSHALKLAPRMNDEQAFLLIGKSFLPAVEKIQAGFGDTDNPYKGAIAAARKVLETHVTA